MRWRRTLLAVVGLAATALGAVAVAEPSLVADSGALAGVVEALSEASVRDLLLALVLVILALVAWVSRTGDDDAAEETDDEPDGALARRPERVTAEEHVLTGADLNAAVSLAAAGDEGRLADLRDRLRSLAVARLSRREADPAAARQAVDAGTWTDRRTAAAFLAGSTGPSQSLRARVQLWLDPEAERERRIAATVRALEALDGRAR
jgi:hypothetical protein